MKSDVALELIMWSMIFNNFLIIFFQKKNVFSLFEFLLYLYIFLVEKWLSIESKFSPIKIFVWSSI